MVCMCINRQEKTVLIPYNILTTYNSAYGSVVMPPLSGSPASASDFNKAQNYFYYKLIIKALYKCAAWMNKCTLSAISVSNPP
jgi:hypothetical protein